MARFSSDLFLLAKHAIVIISISIKIERPARNQSSLAGTAAGFFCVSDFITDFCGGHRIESDDPSTPF